MKIRVYYEDTDAGGIVYHTNYIKYCERARSEMVFASGAPEFSDAGYFVVSKLVANFRASARLGDLLEVRTRTLKLARASVLLAQSVYKIGSLKSDCEPELLFDAEVTLAFLSGGKPSKISSEYAAIFGGLESE